MKNLVRLLMVFSSLLAFDATAVDLTRAKVIVQQKCQLCHGIDGEASSIVYPRLAGQHEEYMIKQLKNFRSGERQGTMNDLAADLTDDEILEAYGTGERVSSASRQSFGIDDGSACRLRVESRDHADDARHVVVLLVRLANVGINSHLVEAALEGLLGPEVA